MKKDSSYSFIVSISRDQYLNKAQVLAAISNKEIGIQLRKQHGVERKIAFRNTTVTPSQLLDLALDGYTFCTLHSNFPNPSSHYVTDDGCYYLSGKADKYFAGSYFIGVDIDCTDYATPQDFVSKLSHQPTFWYTSLSHMQYDDEGNCKGPRFRLIYVFDDIIQDKYYFRYCSHTIHSELEKETNEIIHDKCGLSSSQYFNGTNRKDASNIVDYHLTNYIYSLCDFDISNIGYLYFLSHNCFYKRPTPQQLADIAQRKCILLSQDTKIIINTDTQLVSEWDKSIRFSNHTDLISPALINDAVRLSYDDFFCKYKHLYQYVYRVELPDWSVFCHKDLGEIKYQRCGNDYFELQWPTARGQAGQKVLLADHHHRRSTLFHRAWMRRIIKPSITPDEMFFNLIKDREMFIDNTDGNVSVAVLIDKVIQAFQYDTDFYIQAYYDKYLETIYKSRKKKIILHWSSRNIIRSNSLIKELNWEVLDVIYNPEESVADNIDMLASEYGFKVSRSALYRYCQNRGISGRSVRIKYLRFLKLHKGGMSLRQEQQYLQENGLSLSLRTIEKYAKEYQKEVEQMLPFSPVPEIQGIP